MSIMVHSGLLGVLCSVVFIVLYIGVVYLCMKCEDVAWPGGEVPHYYTSPRPMSHY
jgi:hypothetical protein